jgi:hypothetical protein
MSKELVVEKAYAVEAALKIIQTFESRSSGNAVVT